MAGINSSETLNWLAGIGSSDRGDTVQLNRTATVLVQLAELLMSEAENNLQKGAHMASGKTAQSMAVVNVQTTATKASLEIEIASTYKFLDQGVKGVESGSSRAGYAFKTKYPNKKMAAAIRAWLRVRRVATKYKAVSKNEGKNKRINKLVQSRDGRLTGLSYGIATNIKKHGIKPTLFFTNAVKTTKAAQRKMVADAFKLDIIETLNKMN